MIINEGDKTWLKARMNGDKNTRQKETHGGAGIARPCRDRNDESSESMPLLSVHRIISLNKISYSYQLDQVNSAFRLSGGRGSILLTIQW